MFRIVVYFKSSLSQAYLTPKELNNVTSNNSTL